LTKLPKNAGINEISAIFGSIGILAIGNTESRQSSSESASPFSP
jgi:hypothetical protein